MVSPRVQSMWRIPAGLPRASLTVGAASGPSSARTTLATSSTGTTRDSLSRSVSIGMGSGSSSIFICIGLPDARQNLVYGVGHAVLFVAEGGAVGRGEDGGDGVGHGDSQAGALDHGFVVNF